MTPKLEKVAEGKFAHRLKRDYNLRAIKFVDPSRRGAPDRIVPLPKGICVFVEFKRAGEQPRAEQREYAAWLRSMGHIVYCCSYADEALGFVESHLDFRP